MSFEPTPPPAGTPADATAPLPATPGLPVYRQDEFVRRPTAWTVPMQRAVAAYLVISIVIGAVNQLLFASEVKALAAKQIAKSFAQSGRAAAQADIDQAVNLGLTFALVFGVIFGVIFIILAILTVTRARTWVFWVDLVFLALGIFGLFGAITSFTDPANSQLPAGSRPLSLVSSLADLALVVWMVAGLVKYGPWAQEKAPAAL